MLDGLHNKLERSCRVVMVWYNSEMWCGNDKVWWSIMVNGSVVRQWWWSWAGVLVVEGGEGESKLH